MFIDWQESPDLCDFVKFEITSNTEVKHISSLGEGSVREGNSPKTMELSQQTDADLQLNIALVI